MGGVAGHHGSCYLNNEIGHYIPIHPLKCGGATSIEYKSRLERLCMMYLDKNESIISWNYEGRFVYYFDKSTNKRRRYFIDFIAKVKISELLSKTVWIEVKSLKEVDPPKNKKNAKAIATYIKNLSKWEAARILAKSLGAEFVILTEKLLY